jgi:hypothetical protein
MFVRTVGFKVCLVVMGLFTHGCGDDADGGKDSHAPRGKDASVADGAAPTDDDAGGTAGLTRWVGEVEDSDVLLGVVVDGGARARVFFCGGSSSFASSTRWVLTDVDSDGAFSFEDMGWRVEGEIGDGRIRGRLEIGDDAGQDFSAAPIRAGTLAGLYEGQSECGRVGLIVLQDRPSSPPRGQGACVGAGHLPEQVSPILPITLEAGAIAVEIGDVQADVRPAGPAPTP